MSDKPEKSSKPDKYEEIKKEIIFGTGYKNPPEHTRFKKGQSGNPKGRPRKVVSKPSDLTLTQQPVLDAIHKAADKQITIREGDQVRDVTAREALTQAVIVSALKGNSRAQAEALKWIKAADEAYAAAIQVRNTFWSNYKTEKSAEIANAKEKGIPEPVILPHPDDIVIDYQTGPKFLGPIDEKDQERIDHFIELREVLILQCVSDAYATHTRESATSSGSGSALLIAMCLDLCVPPRLRLAQEDLYSRCEAYGRLRKQERRERLSAGWQRLGYPVRDGYVFPEIGEVLPHLNFCFSVANAVGDGQIDALNESQADVEEKLVDLMEQNGLRPI